MVPATDKPKSQSNAAAPGKRPRPATQSQSPTHPSKKQKSTSNTKKQQQQQQKQQLISRFFTSSSSAPRALASTPSKSKPKPKSKTKQNPTPQKVNATADLTGDTDADDGKQHEEKQIPDAATQPSLLGNSESQDDVQMKDDGDNEGSVGAMEKEGATKKQADSVGAELEEEDDDDDEPLIVRTRSRSARVAKPRIVQRIDLGSDDDEEDEISKEVTRNKQDHQKAKEGKRSEKPARKTRNKAGSDDDDDYQMDDGDVESGADDDVGEIEEDACGESDTEEEIQDDEKKQKPKKASKQTEDNADEITLASYSFNRQDPKKVLPADEKRRNKLKSKVGRMECGNIFSSSRASIREQQQSQLAATSSGTIKPGTKKKYTPLETQFIDLRNKHPDLLLIIECGYKYRLFDKDALTGSSILKIAAYMDHNFLTASFPTHRLSHHILKLVDANLKVGVVGQCETAALKKVSNNSSSLFTRKLTGVYTKATIIADGNLLNAQNDKIHSNSSFIMTINEFQIGNKKDSEQDIENVGIALCCIDCTTGEIIYDGFKDDVLRGELDSRLLSIEPVEILVSDQAKLSKHTDILLRSYTQNYKARLETIAAGSSMKNEMKAEVSTLFKASNEKTLESIHSCYRLLDKYLKQFQLNMNMSNVIEYKSYHSKKYMKLGSDVIRNFEIFQNSHDSTVKGSLYELLNRTNTKFGSRQMKQWISHPLIQAKDIDLRLQTVDYLRELMSGGEVNHENDLKYSIYNVLNDLGRLPDLEQALMRVTCGKSKPMEVLTMFSAVEQIGLKLDEVKRSMSKLSGNRSEKNHEELPELLYKMFENIQDTEKDIIDHPLFQILNKRAIENEKEQKHLILFNEDLIKDSEEQGPEALLQKLISHSDGEEESEDITELFNNLKELRECNAEMVKALKFMTKLLKRLQSKFSSPSWEWKKVSHDEYLLEISTKKKGQLTVPSDWMKISQTKAVIRYRPPEALKGLEAIQQQREIQDSVYAKCWQSYLKCLTNRIVNKLKIQVHILSNLDCLHSLVKVSYLPNYCKPSIIQDDKKSDKAGIYAKNARHALSELLMTSADLYIPNDIILGQTNEGSDADAKCTKGLVISGPNYGGKSSYTRMTALLIIMAQIGGFVPAEELTIRPFDGIFARMGCADNISKGLSSLMVELAESSTILSKASAKSLVVMDELGRGTSTFDGTAIAVETLKYLVNHIQCISLFVTHYPTVAQLSKTYPNDIAACYMDYREEGNETKKKIILLYKLTKGIASSSYGVNVARLAGLPASVLDEALKQAGKLEQKIDHGKKVQYFSKMFQSDKWDSEENVSNIFVRDDTTN